MAAGRRAAGSTYAERGPAAVPLRPVASGQQAGTYVRTVQQLAEAQLDLVPRQLIASGIVEPRDDLRDQRSRTAGQATLVGWLGLVGDKLLLHHVLSRGAPVNWYCERPSWSRASPVIREGRRLPAPYIIADAEQPLQLSDPPEHVPQLSSISSSC